MINALKKLRRAIGRALCRRGMHSYPKVAQSTVAGDPTQSAQSPWMMYLRADGARVFCSHCKRCGHYRTMVVEAKP